MASRSGQAGNWTCSLDVLHVSWGEVSESTCPVAAQTSATRTSLWGQICSCCQVILTKAVSHGLRGSEFWQLAAAHSDAAHSGGPLGCEGCGKTQDLPGCISEPFTCESCINTHLCMLMYIHISEYIHKCTYTDTSIYIHKYTHLFIHIHTHIHKPEYIHVYAHPYIHIHTFMYKHISE